MNFVSKKLIVSYDDSVEFLIDKIKDIVSSHEADTKVIEVLKPNAIKRTKKEANFISTIENTNEKSLYQERKPESIKSEVEADHRCDNNHKHDEHKYINDKKESQEYGHNHQGHGHSHEDDISFKKDIIKIQIGAIIFLSAIVLQTQGGIRIVLFLVSYMIIGGEILIRALKNILKGQVFDENFLMTIATIGAFAMGEFPEGVAVMLFYQIGEIFQDLAVNRSRKSIANLMDIRPDYANLKTDNGIERVSPEEVIID